MSDISTLLAGSKSFVHKGKTYTVSLVDQSVKARYEGWLKAQALDLLISLKPLVDPAEWDRQFAQHKEDVSSGVYGFHGSLAQRSLTTPVGSLKISSLLFNVSDDEMSRLVMEAGDSVKALLDSVAVESFPFAKYRDQPEGNG